MGGEIAMSKKAISKKAISKKDQATLRAFLARNPDKYDLMLYFGRYSAKYLKRVSTGTEVGSTAAEFIRESCAELRETARGQGPVLFREGR